MDGDSDPSSPDPINPIRKDFIARDARVTRKGARIQNLGVGEAHGLEEASEVAQVPNHSLGAHLLLEVEAHVSSEDIPWSGGIHHQRNQPPFERAFEGEGWPLRGHERVKGPEHRAPPEEVDAALPELPRARACEHVPLPRARLDEIVHDVEELGNPLDLIDDHIPLGGGSPQNHLAEPLRSCLQDPELLRMQEVQPERSGQGLP
jgi:hypothetical protein